MSTKTIIFDTETTGVDATKDEILQLSIIDDAGKTLFDEFFKPERATEWKRAEEINHISPEKVANKKSIKAFQKQLLEIFSNADVIAGYNVNFDLKFIASSIGFQLQDNQEVFDVMPVFSQMYGDWDEWHHDYRWQKLTTAAEYFDFDWSAAPQHSALGDCLATLHVMKKLKQAELDVEQEEADAAAVSKALEHDNNGRTVDGKERR